MNKKILTNNMVIKNNMVKKNKRGFIFSLDIAIAVSIVILLLVAAHKHMINSEEQKISNFQMVRTGSDILAVMDNEGTLSLFDINTLEEEISVLLPTQYRMVIKLVSSDNVVLFAGGAVPHDRFVGTGKRFFIVGSGATLKFGKAEFFIWRE